MTKGISIIQTLYLPDSSGNAMNESLGFLSHEFNWMGWALSCLQLKRYYPNVYLYTNSRGYDVLINRLKLPYSDSMIVLNDVEFPPQLWAYPKLHVYNLQTGPFIHVDGDAFFWEPLDSGLLGSPLIAQNLEVNERYYSAVIQQMTGCGLQLPETISTCLASGIPLGAYNAGIIGGTDIDFFKEYTAEAFNFLQVNKEKLQQVSEPQFNMVFEQVLFYCLARLKQREVSCYIKQPLSDMTYPGFANFADVPYHTKYIHLMGSFKTNAECCYMLAKRLRQNYPEYYCRIIEECKRANNELFLNCYRDSEKKNAIANDPLAEKGIDWQKIYQKEKQQAEKIENAFGNTNQLPEVKFRTNRLLKLSSNSGAQSIYDVPDSYSRQFKKVNCDELDQLLITALKRAKTFDALLTKISKYFDKEDLEDRASFSKLISLRMRAGCFNNVFEIV